MGQDKYSVWCCALFLFSEFVFTGPIKHDANEDNISTANIITSTIAANDTVIFFCILSKLT